MVTTNRTGHLPIGGLAQEGIVGRKPPLKAVTVVAAKVEYDHGTSLVEPELAFYHHGQTGNLFRFQVKCGAITSTGQAISTESLGTWTRQRRSASASDQVLLQSNTASPETDTIVMQGLRAGGSAIGAKVARNAEFDDTFEEEQP